MINVLAIRSGLAFAPYLIDSLQTFLETGEPISRVIRQAASGFIIRSEGELTLRHQNREAALGQGEAFHYLATIRLRQKIFDVVRKSDEVVFASVGKSLLLSHPQSELWIDATVIPTLLEAFRREVEPDNGGLPQWLTLAGGDGRLLLSDQRNGRWVLLGSDHFAELERRQNSLNSSFDFQKIEKAPTFTMKGLTIPIQAALTLSNTIEEFAKTGVFQPYEEPAPTYQLTVLRAPEGMKISDGNVSIAMTAKEAQKWTVILKTELEKYQVLQSERGKIRSVSARVEQGLWIWQWGDEIFLSNQMIREIQTRQNHNPSRQQLAALREKDLLLLLDKASGACVALVEEETERHLFGRNPNL